jgi:hypothetical protein
MQPFNAELVELSLVTRESPHEPLVREFLRIALTQPHDTACLTPISARSG